MHHAVKNRYRTLHSRTNSRKCSFACYVNERNDSRPYSKPMVPLGSCVASSLAIAMTVLVATSVVDVEKVAKRAFTL